MSTLQRALIKTLVTTTFLCLTQAVSGQPPSPAILAQTPPGVTSPSANPSQPVPPDNHTHPPNFLTIFSTSTVVAAFISGAFTLWNNQQLEKLKAKLEQEKEELRAKLEQEKEERVKNTELKKKIADVYKMGDHAREKFSALATAAPTLSDPDLIKLCATTLSEFSKYQHSVDESYLRFEFPQGTISEQTIDDSINLFAELFILISVDKGTRSDPNRIAAMNTKLNALRQLFKDFEALIRSFS